MPTSPPTRCTGCNGLIPKGGRCTNPDCTWSYSRYKRNGITTSNPRWAKLRERRLAIDPTCTWVGDDGGVCTEDATDVDHLDGTDYSDHSGEGRSWLSIYMTRSLCADHHAKRTAEQSAMSRRQYS